jgi:hypothetical protein
MLEGADAFNCGTDRFGTMREVLEHLCRHAGTGSNVKSLAAVAHGDRDETSPPVWESHL